MVHPLTIKTRDNEIIPSICPALSGSISFSKVERTQQTDKTEFWSCFDLADRSLDLNALAMEWQDFYNKKRPHSSLGGMTPWQKLRSVEHLISDQYDYAESLWNPDEKIMTRNYEYLKLLKKNNISPYSRKPVEKKKK